MSTWQIFCAVASLAFAAYACWPAVSKAGGFAIGGVAKLFSGWGSTTSTKATKVNDDPNYFDVMQSLSVMAHYKANCKDDPEYGMVMSSFKTLEQAP